MIPSSDPWKGGLRPNAVEVLLKHALRWGKYILGAAALTIGALLLIGRAIDKRAAALESAVDIGHVGPNLLQGNSDGVRARILTDSPAYPSPSLAKDAPPANMSQCGEPPMEQHPSSGQDKSKLPSMFTFILCCFLACSALDHVNLYVPIAWRFPISVVIFISGFVVGSFFLHVTKGGGHMNKGFDNLIIGMHDAARFDPHALLYIILPPLLYESASSMKWHVLRKVLPSAIVLAVPGVLLNTLLTGCFVRVAFQVDGNSPTWGVSMLTAAILSATDPVAVVAALSALGAPLKLSSLVEGESLLNDGSAVVAAYVFRDWVMGDNAKFCPGSPPPMGCVVGFFLQGCNGRLRHRCVIRDRARHVDPPSAQPTFCNVGAQHRAHSRVRLIFHCRGSTNFRSLGCCRVGLCDV